MTSHSSSLLLPTLFQLFLWPAASMLLVSLPWLDCLCWLNMHHLDDRWGHFSQPCYLYLFPFPWVNECLASCSSRDLGHPIQHWSLDTLLVLCTQKRSVRESECLLAPSALLSEKLWLNISIDVLVSHPGKHCSNTRGPLCLDQSHISET